MKGLIASGHNTGCLFLDQGHPLWLKDMDFNVLPSSLASHETDTQNIAGNVFGWTEHSDGASPIQKNCNYQELWTILVSPSQYRGGSKASGAGSGPRLHLFLGPEAKGNQTGPYLGK